MERLARLLIPGLVLQGVIIGGGYATGREVVEFFLQYGVLGGLFGFALVALIWAFVLAIAFSFAQKTNSYNYGSFTASLLGPFRYLFDLTLLAMLLLIIAVILTAGGEITASTTGLPVSFGAVALGVMIGVGLLLPAPLLSGVISLWSVVLYIAYVTLAFIAIRDFGDDIRAAFRAADVKDGWVLSAMQYSAYNLAAIPAVLFTLRAIRSKKEAATAGVLASILSIAPGILLAIVLAAFLPDILSAAVPLNVVLESLADERIALLMQIAIIGTFWQTGVGSLNALNDRIAFAIAPRVLPIAARPAIAFAFVTLALGVGMTFGIIDIVARGYGALTFIFFAVLVIPLLTVGLRKILRPSDQTHSGLVEQET